MSNVEWVQLKNSAQQHLLICWMYKLSAQIKVLKVLSKNAEPAEWFAECAEQKCWVAELKFSLAAQLKFSTSKTLDSAVEVLNAEFQISFSTQH